MNDDLMTHFLGSDAVKDLKHLLDDLDRLRAAEKRIREAHVSRTIPALPPEFVYCRECHTAWPCPTIRALDGAE